MSHRNKPHEVNVFLTSGSFRVFGVMIVFVNRKCRHGATATEATMRKSTPILLSAGLLRLSVAVFLIISLACVVPSLSVATPDPNSVGTAIMATMISAVTQTAGAGVPVGLVDTPLPTLTELPTLSPTATLSPTPVFTNTPLVPQISVSVDTNCRVGPGKIYDRVGALLVGEVAEVVGRNPTGDYWYIRNPDQTNGFCWLWGEYATVTGNFIVLPVYTPPPTPTPAPGFEAFYAGLETCAGWWVEIGLTNTGGVPFQSVSLTVRDTDTDIVLSMYSDSFTDIDGCLDSSTRDVLNPGDTRTISAPAFAYDPDGHQVRATITLCSGNGQSGACITEVIKFKP